MSRTKTIAVGAICAVAATGTTATAASLITSAKIADGTIMNRDIHRGTISESRLDHDVAAKLNRLAVPGPAGANGATGATGATGAKGDTGATGTPGDTGQVGGVAGGLNGKDGLDGATGPAGPAGPKGDTGAAGKDGAPGLDGKDGAVGPKGDKGDTGAAGKDGAPGLDGKDGAVGPKGDTGATGVAGKDGVDGKDGVNPARLVAKDGDQGWALMGTPAAKLTGGELRLAGSFDKNTTAGGIGITHAYAQAPLSTLSSLIYTARVDKRPNGTVNAPVIHVTLTGARRATGTSTFTNLVFEPANNGGIGVGETKTFDTLVGQWWSTNDLVGHPRQATAPLSAFIADNPDAKITFISVDNGGSSENTIPVDDFAAAADNLVVGFGDSFDRYDFGG